MENFTESLVDGEFASACATVLVTRIIQNLHQNVASREQEVHSRISQKTEIVKSAEGPKLQGFLAENASPKGTRGPGEIVESSGNIQGPKI